MREIKFRAWDKTVNKMAYSAFSVDASGFGVTDAGWRPRGTKKDDYELMQYIGLKDKNGKEGYNSDLFKDKKGVIYLVDHDEDGWIFKNGDVGYRPSTFRTSIPYSLDGEFIGNIYENPELLEK